MDMGTLNLAMKMIQEDYKLSSTEMTTLTHRMLADDREFERIWGIYKSTKTRRFVGGVDRFKDILQELLT